MFVSKYIFHLDYVCIFFLKQQYLCDLFFFFFVSCWNASFIYCFVLSERQKKEAFEWFAKCMLKCRKTEANWVKKKIVLQGIFWTHFKFLYVDRFILCCHFLSYRSSREKKCAIEVQSISSSIHSTDQSKRKIDFQTHKKIKTNQKILSIEKWNARGGGSN